MTARIPTGTLLLVGLSVLLLTSLSYFVFPGHTYLLQDSQIYVPILEHLLDPAVLANDLIAVRHHVTFTIWDELALFTRWLTGLSFDAILTADHVLHRAFGIIGIYLIATAMKLSRRMAILVAAIYALGATIGGPAVLTVEYEPKPRASAVPMLLLAMGCAAHAKYLAAGICGSIAFLYHPPTVYPFWLVFFAMDLWPARPDVMKKRIYGLAPLALAVVVLFIFTRIQAGGPEPQPPLGTIDPELEQLQRMRANYSWISEWARVWLGQHLFVWAVSILAFLRLRRDMPVSVQFFSAGMPLVGMLSMPASYLLLDRWKWALMPKFQPMRALLFVTLFMIVLAIIAAIKAAQASRWPEAFAWAFLGFAPVIQSRISLLLIPNLADPIIRTRLIIAIALAALVVAAAWFESRREPASSVVWAAAVIAPFLLLPYHGKVPAAEPSAETSEIQELSAWAAANTPKDAVFLFPGIGKALYPGVFRVRAQRAIYVDWKGGGQVNMVKEFGAEWWERWQQTGVPRFTPELMEKYEQRGIDYIIVSPKELLPNHAPLFENARFLVYQVRRTPRSARVPLDPLKLPFPSPYV